MGLENLAIVVISAWATLDSQLFGEREDSHSSAKDNEMSVNGAMEEERDGRAGRIDPQTIPEPPLRFMDGL